MAIELLLFDLGGVLVNYAGFAEIGALMSEAANAGGATGALAACGAERFETGMITPLSSPRRWAAS